MKRFFKVLSIVITLTIVFTGLISCYTVSAAIEIEGPSQNFNWFDWSIEALKEVGLIFNPDRLHPTPLEMAEAINQNDSTANVLANDNSINEYINNNTTYNNQNNSKTYNNNSKFVLNYLSNYYMNDIGYFYCYSIKLNQSFEAFPSGDIYNAYRRWMNQYQNDYYCVYYLTTNNVPRSIAYKKNANLVGLWTDRFTSAGTDIICINLYSTQSWEKYSFSNQEALRFQYNSDTNEFESLPFANFPYVENGQVVTLKEDGYGLNSFNNTIGAHLISNNASAILVYKTINDLKAHSVGVQPYYVNNSVYNNYSQSTGDYTVTNDNSNHATYGDISNYVNSFNNENGYYPNPEQINVYIENVTPENTNPDNPSGGSGGNANATATAQGGTATAEGGTASANNEGINITINNNHNINLGGGSGLSGNTVSGNGSGSSGGIGGIFDFLSQIGDFLGSLIKNIGNVLADIVTGIGSVVSSLLEVIPTVFNDFLGGVLGWLPPELRALVTLSISAMIIVGLIKLFRG